MATSVPTHDSTSLRTGESVVGSNTYTIVASVTTQIYPQSTFGYTSTDYSMGTNVVTKIYPQASFTFTEGQPVNNFTLVGDGTSINLTWQPGTPKVSFALQGDVTLTFTQPNATLRFRQNSVLLGNYGITFTPSASFLLTKPGYIDGQNSIWIRPSSDMTIRGRTAISGSSSIQLKPSASMWAFNGIVTSRRFIPGYFATKDASGTVDGPEATKQKILAIVEPLFPSRDISNASINDLWMYFFDTEHVPDGSINDRMAYWLRYEKGVDGDSINDLMSNWNGVL